MRVAMMTLALALVAMQGTEAAAKPIPQVQEFLKKEITRLQTVQEPRVPRDGSYVMGDYAMSTFRLRIKAEVGFDIWIARVAVEPIAEFFWE